MSTLPIALLDVMLLPLIWFRRYPAYHALTAINGPFHQVQSFSMGTFLAVRRLIHKMKLGFQAMHSTN